MIGNELYLHGRSFFSFDIEHYTVGYTSYAFDGVNMYSIIFISFRQDSGGIPLPNLTGMSGSWLNELHDDPGLNPGAS